MEDYKKYIQKLNVKEADVVILFLPTYYLNTPNKGVQVKNFIKKFEKQLPYNNKVVVLPKDIDMKVVEKDDQKLLGEDWGFLMSYRLKYLIDKLIMKAFIYSENYPKSIKTPGKLIKQLTKEERKLLKGAKSEDFYHRI